VHTSCFIVKSYMFVKLYCLKWQHVRGWSSLILTNESHYCIWRESVSVNYVIGDVVASPWRGGLDGQSAARDTIMQQWGQRPRDVPHTQWNSRCPVLVVIMKLMNWKQIGDSESFSALYSPNQLSECYHKRTRPLFRIINRPNCPPPGMKKKKHLFWPKM
jgi:hypothetical protein